MSKKNTTPDLKAFATTQSGDKTFYHEIGAAWKNSNGGYSIKLYANPINGDIVLFPPKAKKQ